MQRLLSAFTILVVTLFFIGCGASVGQPQVRTLPQIKQNKKIVKFNFPEYDCVTGEKLDIDLSDFDLSNRIEKFSEYRKLRKYRELRGLYTIRGMHAYRFSNKNLYKIYYKNGELYTHDSGSSKKYLTEVIFEIPYKINKTTLEFSYPTSYIYIQATNPLGTDYQPLDRIDNLQKDIDQIFNKLSSIKLTVKKVYTLQGEINTKFPSESIYANFKRILGNWKIKTVTTNDIKKENTFALPVGKNKYPLKIEVYPYRNGSKVIYSVAIQYTISSNNTCSLSKEDVEKAKKFIEKIIND